MNNQSNDTINQKPKNIKIEASLSGSVIVTIISLIIIPYLFLLAVAFIIGASKNILVNAPSIVRIIFTSLLISGSWYLTYYFSVRDRFRKRYLSKENCQKYILIIRIVNVIFGFSMIYYNIYSNNASALYSLIAYIPGIIGAHFIIKKVVEDRNKFVFEE